MVKVHVFIIVVVGSNTTPSSIYFSELMKGNLVISSVH